MLTNKPTELELDSLRALIRGFVERGEIPGISLLLAHHGNIVFEEACGWADIEAQKPFTTETIASLASTTKPLSATCLMTLVEEGKISLDDPVSKYLPAFGELRVQGTDVKAPSPTIRQLLSHTASFFSHPMSPAHREIVFGESQSLAEVVDLIAKEELVSEPGSHFGYGPTSFEVAGRIAEVITGQSFAVLMVGRLLKPLGMVDTTFGPSGDRAARVVTVYQPHSDGFKSYLRYPFEAVINLPRVAGKLYSTPRDVAVFLQMHLNEGAYGPTRILLPSTVAEIQREQTGDSELRWSPYGDRKNYGLGWFRDRIGPDGQALSVSHAGAFGTIAWIDIDRKLVGVLFINVPLGNAKELHAAVREKVLGVFPVGTPG